MSEIDWSLLGPPVDIPGAIQQGYQTGRALRTQREQDSALHALSANPDDAAAQNALMATNPELAIHYQRASLEREDALRKGHARSATSDVIRAFAPPSAAPAASAFAQPMAVTPSLPSPQQNAPGAALPQRDPLPPLQNASLPVLGAPSATAAPVPAVTQQPPAPDAAPSSVLDPSHPVTQAVGAAVASQRMSPTEAVAELARYADPEQVQQVLGTIKTMDGMRLSQLAEANDAVGVAAQTLLGIPDDPGHVARRQALMAQQDQLAQHGVTPEQLASADLSDAGLHGRIGQAIGVKAMVEAAQKDREFGLEQQKFGETVRHDRAGEHAAMIKEVQPGGSVVDFSDGSGTPSTAGGGAPAPGHTGGGRYATNTSGVVVNGKLDPVAYFNGVMSHYEGGYNPHDLNGAPVNHGINGAANPGVNIKDLTTDQAAQIFATKYFPQSGAANLPPALAAVHADTFFMNEKKAKQFLAQSGGDPQKYMDLREAWQRRLEARHPEVAEAWNSRNADLRDVANQLSGGGAPAADGNPAPQGGRVLYTAPPKPSDPVIGDDGARLAAAIYKTKGTLPTGIARTKGDVDKIMGIAAHMSMDEAHQVADQTVSTWQDTRAAQDTLVAFSKGKQADQTRSLNVAIHHIDLVRQAAAALENGNVPLFNSIAQHISQASGHAAPTNFDALKQFVFDEVTKGAIGSSGALGDRQEASRSASRASSPQQLVGVLDNYQTLLGGQAKGLQHQYEAGTGRHDYADKYLEPRTRQILLGQGAPHGNIPTLTPDQARAAPPGTLFRTSDGRMMRKR